jgi:hypothetical protein
MKKLFGMVMVVAFISSCTKDGTDQVWESLIEKKAPKEKITVCHKQGNGSFHSITISRNALPAHKAHGFIGVYAVVCCSCWMSILARVRTWTLLVPSSKPI